MRRVWVIVPSIIACGTGAIILMYTWVLPEMFGGLKSYWPFNIGVIGSAFCGGYVAFNERGRATSAGRRLAVGVICGVVEGLLVAVFSLTLLVNILGA